MSGRLPEAEVNGGLMNKEIINRALEYVKQIFENDYKERFEQHGIEKLC